MALRVCKQLIDTVSDETPKSLRIWLGTRSDPLEATNDGGLYISKSGAWSGSIRYGKVAVVSFEVRKPSFSNLPPVAHTVLLGKT